MAEDVFRAFVLKKDGKVSAAHVLHGCNSDEDAIRQAKSMLKDQPLEVWKGARRICILRPDGEDAS